MNGLPVTINDSLLTRRALESTKQFIWSLVNQHKERWEELLDEQFVLVTPEGVSYGLAEERLGEALAELGRLLRRSPSKGGLQYHAQPFSEHACGVVVSNVPAPHNSESEHLLNLSYCMFVWIAHGQDIKLSHCRLIVHPTSESHATPHEVPPAIRRTARLSSRLQVRTADGEYYWIERSDIVFVRARGQYTELHCTTRMLLLHALIKNVLAQIGTSVVRIARSYAVNPQFVDSLRSEMLYLTTGDKVPVPARRIKEVRELLTSVL